MQVCSTKHFRERCKERNFPFRKIKKAAAEGKTQIRIDNNTRIRIVTEVRNNLIFLITAFVEKSECHVCGEHNKCSQSKLRYLKSKIQKREKEDVV